jgi:hypothetical protein
MKIVVILLMIIGVNSLISNRFFKRFLTVCIYNKKNLNAIIEKNKEEIIIPKKDLEYVYLENLSGSSSQQISEILEDIFREINSEYFYLWTIILSEFIKYTINEVTSVKSREEIARLLVKNVLIPVIIHDSLKLLFIALKAIFNSLHF